MLTLTRRNDRSISDLVFRLDGSRSERYFYPHTSEQAEMPRMFREYFNHFVKGKDCSMETKTYVRESIRAFKKEQDSSYLNGLIGMYNDQYVICFLNISGLDTCGLKLTYNDREKRLFESFMSDCTKAAQYGLYMTALRMLKDKQRIHLLKEEETCGIIYSTFPEKDIVVDYGFINYTNKVKAFQVANKTAMVSVSDALEKGVSVKEINDVFPEDTEARFFNRDFDLFELSQIDSLVPNVKDLA